MRFGDVFVNLCLGMSAMAQGRVREASAAYGRARQGARKSFASDPCLTVSTDALAIELDLERNRERQIQPRTLQSMAEVRGVWSEVYATAIAVTAELTFAQYSREAAIQLLSRAVDDVGATGIASLSRHMAALLAQYLVEVERVDEAGRVWRDHGLAVDTGALLDVDRQSWRTMEALSCARVRLLAAQGEWAAAEELATRLREVASERGLVRTLLRSLALSMVVAHGAGRSDRAVARLVDYLGVTREVDYLRPLVRHRDISVTVLRRVLDTVDDEDVRPAAESMLLQLDAPAAPTTLIFSARELEVLAGVREGLRNKDIAGRLGMTDEGVRYLTDPSARWGPPERSKERMARECTAKGWARESRPGACAEPRSLVSIGGIVGPPECARVLTAVKALRSAPPPRRGARPFREPLPTGSYPQIDPAEAPDSLAKTLPERW